MHDNKDVFLLDLLNLYNKTILRGLENLLQFFIGRYNLSGIDYADDTVLMADSEKKTLKELLDMVVEESKKKRLINCKKTKRDC